MPTSARTPLGFFGQLAEVGSQAEGLPEISRGLRKRSDDTPGTDAQSETGVAQSRCSQPAPLPGCKRRFVASRGIASLKPFSLIGIAMNCDMIRRKSSNRNGVTN